MSSSGMDEEVRWRRRDKHCGQDPSDIRPLKSGKRDRFIKGNGKSKIKRTLGTREAGQGTF